LRPGAKPPRLGRDRLAAPAHRPRGVRRAPRPTPLALRRAALLELALHPLVEFGDVHHHALVQPVADHFPLVARLQPEVDGAAVDSLDLRGSGDTHADRRGSDMADVEDGAVALVAR